MKKNVFVYLLLFMLVGSRSLCLADSSENMDLDVVVDVGGTTTTYNQDNSQVKYRQFGNGHEYQLVNPNAPYTGGAKNPPDYLTGDLSYEIVRDWFQVDAQRGEPLNKEVKITPHYLSGIDRPIDHVGARVIHQIKFWPKDEIFLVTEAYKFTQEELLADSLQLEKEAVLKGFKSGATYMIIAYDGYDQFSKGKNWSLGFGGGGNTINSAENLAFSGGGGTSKGEATAHQEQPPFAWYVFGKLYPKSEIAKRWFMAKGYYCQILGKFGGNVELFLEQYKLLDPTQKPVNHTWAEFIDAVLIEKYILAQISRNRSCELPEELEKKPTTPTFSLHGNQYPVYRQAPHILYCEFGKSKVLPGEKQKLEENIHWTVETAKSLKDYEVIYVASYCSTPGTDEYNWGELGKERALIVGMAYSNELFEKGFSREWIRKHLRPFTAGNFEPVHKPDRMAPDGKTPYNPKDQRIETFVGPMITK